MLDAHKKYEIDIVSQGRTVKFVHAHQSMARIISDAWMTGDRVKLEMKADGHEMNIDLRACMLHVRPLVGEFNQQLLVSNVVKCSQ